MLGGSPLLSLIGILELILGLGLRHLLYRLENLGLAPLGSLPLLFPLPFLCTLGLEAGPFLLVLNQFHVALLVGSEESLRIHLICHVRLGFRMIGPFVGRLQLLLHLVHPSKPLHRLLPLQLLLNLCLPDRELAPPSCGAGLHQVGAGAFRHYIESTSVKGAVRQKQMFTYHWWRCSP